MKRGNFKYKKRVETYQEGQSVSRESNTVVQIHLDDPKSPKYVELTKSSHLMDWLKYIYDGFVTFFGESLVSEPFGYLVNIGDTEANFSLLNRSKYSLEEEERWQVYENGTLVIFKLDRLPGCSENPYIPVVQLYKPIDNETCRYILAEHIGLPISFPEMRPKLRTKWDELGN